MSAEEMGSPELWGISEDAWTAGWRRTIEDAVKAEFAGAKIDEPSRIEIWAVKRSDNAVHDYRVQRTGP
jgi:hypothetical protein